jgi:hypothetical protein
MIDGENSNVELVNEVLKVKYATYSLEGAVKLT